MAALPTGRDGRILAGLLAVLTLAVIWLGVVTPISDWYDKREAQLSLLRQREARETALIAALPALKAAAEQASHTPTQAVLSGATDAIAGAGLQEQVRGMASAAGAQLTSIESLPGEQAGAYRRVGVRVELNAQLPVIVALVKAIEEAQPAMLVDDIHLTGTPIVNQGAPLPLDCAFTVYAFRVGSAKDSGE